MEEEHYDLCASCERCYTCQDCVICQNCNVCEFKMLCDRGYSVDPPGVEDFVTSTGYKGSRLSNAVRRILYWVTFRWLKLKREGRDKWENGDSVVVYHEDNAE